MALILEIRDRRGTVTWHTLDRLPLTLGRGLANDVILDDPYTDARHAVIAGDDAGGLTISDLGSVNGLKVNNGRTTSVTVQPGLQLQLGRTRLRFRDRDEFVAPALADSTQRLSRLTEWVTRPSRSRLLLLAFVAVTAVEAWFGSTQQSVGSEVMFGLLAALGMLVLWATVWSLAVRGADRRIQWLAHIAVTSAAGLAIMAYDVVNEWLLFLFPDASVVPIVYAALVLSVLATLVAGHFEVAGVLTPRGRWRVGWSVSGVIVLLIGLNAVTEGDQFSSVAEFPGQLKLASEWMVPTSSVDEFGAAISQARAVVDEAIVRPTDKAR